MRWTWVTAAALSVCACNGGSKFCGPSNCAGCCDALGECHAGLENANCGNDGELCRFCSGDTFCDNAVCVTRSIPSGTGGGTGGGATGGGLAAGGGLGGGIGGGAGGGTGGGGGPHNDAGFPAAHPPFPQVMNLGGPVMAHPRFISVTFANDSALLTSAIDDFIATVGTTPYWTQVTQEYGIGPATAAPPVHLAEQPGGRILAQDIDTWLQQHLTGDSPALGPPDPDTLYVLTYPPGVTIDFDGIGESCTAFGGYHYMTSVDGGPVSYAVLPRCPNIVFNALNDADNLTGVASHELIEAVTDPLPWPLPAWAQTDDEHIAWDMVIGGELADLCTWDTDAFFTPAGYNHMVQRSWSNAAAANGGHGCVPKVDSSFGAVPEFEDRVEYDWKALALSGHTDGVSIPLGQERTVLLDLYSETPEQLFVSATEISTGYTLDIRFPEGASGWNGDKVKMTIRHLADDPSFGGSVFMLTTTSAGGATHYSFGFVGD